MVLFDYFRVSGGGDFFDVSSYAAIDYSEIPVYSPNKVDLGGLEPDGTFELSDCLDFRPVVGQIIGTIPLLEQTIHKTHQVQLTYQTPLVEQCMHHLVMRVVSSFLGARVVSPKQMHNAVRRTCQWFNSLLKVTSHSMLEESIKYSYTNQEVCKYQQEHQLYLQLNQQG